MTRQLHKRIDLAEQQLATAISLFLIGKYFPAITLAGAADVLLCQLVVNAGHKNFTQAVLQNEGDSLKTVQQRGKELNDMFHINDLKHMDAGDDGNVTMDPKQDAVGAILKALPNYILLRSRKAEFVQDFMKWVRENLDPKVYNIHCDPNWKSGRGT